MERCEAFGQRGRGHLLGCYLHGPIMTSETPGSGTAEMATQSITP